MSRRWWRDVSLLKPFDPPELPSWEQLRRRGPSRTAAAVRARWRAWMAVPLLLLVVAVAAVLPVEATVEQPSVIVDARSLAQVDADRAGSGSGYTGAYLLPRVRTSATALAWATAMLAPGRSPAAAETRRTAQGVPLLDVALLTGAGVAPGREDPAELGLAAGTTAPDVPEDQLGLLLHVADSAHRRDLADGRRVLALGAVTAAGTLRCPADPAASVAATSPPPDLVLLGRDCGTDLDGITDARVAEVAVLADALAVVARSDRTP